MESSKKHKSFFFQPTENKKWYQFRKMDKREYGYTAVVGLLAGGIFSVVIGSALAFFGLVCGIIWIILVIKERRNERNKTV